MFTLQIEIEAFICIGYLKDYTSLKKNEMQDEKDCDANVVNDEWIMNLEFYCILASIVLTLNFLFKALPDGPSTASLIAANTTSNLAMVHVIRSGSTAIEKPCC